MTFLSFLVCRMAEWVPDFLWGLAKLAGAILGICALGWLIVHPFWLGVAIVACVVAVMGVYVWCEYIEYRNKLNRALYSEMECGFWYRK